MVPSSEQVYEALKGVNDPELGGNIVELGMVSYADVTADGLVTVGIALTIAECPMRSQIEGDTARRIRAMDGVTDVRIETTAMTKQQRSDLMSVARKRARETAEPTQVSPTTRVIAVSSGKGGVGKSSASVNLAAMACARRVDRCRRRRPAAFRVVGRVRPARQGRRRR